MTPAARADLVARYADGPRLLQEALAAVPREAMQWRPAPTAWSAHEVIVHCADSETQAASRIRILACEKEPVIQGYDQELWARELDYHAQPVDLALATVVAVRAHTAALLRRLPDALWARVGRHSESGRYTAENWLSIYAGHLEDHARQISDNVTEWRRRRG